VKLKPQLSHLGIYVTDIERMIQFYREVMELEVTDRGLSSSSRQPIVFMSAHPEQHHQFVLVHGRPADARFTTINQMSFKVGTLQEIRTIAARAEARGAKLRTVSHGNAWSVYFPDPEGNQIEVYMDTPWHVAQPHGDKLDLALSDADIYQQTEKIVRADPTFKPADEREKELGRMLYPAS
jgi:catechol 2,3-dioxygenase